MNIAIYCRVSTKDQHCENQLIDLRRYANAKQWTITKEYIESGVSGTKDKRPELDKLMDDVRKRKIDGVLVWKFDRFARSIIHLVIALQEMKSLGVEFISYQENIDTSTATGKLMFGIIAAMAEFELDCRRERVAAALERLKAQGLKLGRPVGIKPEIMAKIESLRLEGFSGRAIAADTGISKSHVARIVKSLDNNGAVCKNTVPMGDKQ